MHGRSLDDHGRAGWTWTGGGRRQGESGRGGREQWAVIGCWTNGGRVRGVVVEVGLEREGVRGEEVDVVRHARVWSDVACLGFGEWESFHCYGMNEGGDVMRVCGGSGVVFE